MLIPTEPIGSIPRSGELLDLQKKSLNGSVSDNELADAYNMALQDTIKRFEATGSPVAKIQARVKGTQMASERLKS